MTAADHRSPFDLTGRVAAVVGTSPNIGAGIAIELGRAGAAVACLDADERHAGATADDVRAAGAEAAAVTVDVTDEAGVDAAFRAVEDELGVVDVLVNGPVVYNVKGLLDMPLAEWRQQLRVILDGPFLCTRAVVRRLVSLERPGSVIVLTSTAAYQGEPGNVGYSTGKSGLINFVRSIAMELADRGIRVNSLSPTSTHPREAAERSARWGVPGPAMPPEAFDEIASHVPLGALPVPSDYGRAAVFLASDAAAMVTGTDLRVDAGTVARYWRWDPATTRGGTARA